MLIFATAVYNALPYTVNGKVVSGYRPVSAEKEGVTIGSKSGMSMVDKSQNSKLDNKQSKSNYIFTLLFFIC